MGGPNLEIFKFSVYLFVPLVALIHFGDPKWYREKVIPVRLHRPLQFVTGLTRTVSKPTLPCNGSDSSGLTLSPLPPVFGLFLICHIIEDTEGPKWHSGRNCEDES